MIAMFAALLALTGSPAPSPAPSSPTVATSFASKPDAFISIPSSWTMHQIAHEGEIGLVSLGNWVDMGTSQSIAVVWVPNESGSTNVQDYIAAHNHPNPSILSVETVKICDGREGVMLTMTRSNDRMEKQLIVLTAARIYFVPYTYAKTSGPSAEGQAALATFCPPVTAPTVLVAKLDGTIAIPEYWADGGKVDLGRNYPFAMLGDYLDPRSGESLIVLWGPKKSGDSLRDYATRERQRLASNPDASLLSNGVVEICNGREGWQETTSGHDGKNETQITAFTATREYMLVHLFNPKTGPSVDGLASAKTFCPPLSR